MSLKTTPGKESSPSSASLSLAGRDSTSNLQQDCSKSPGKISSSKSFSHSLWPYDYPPPWKDISALGSLMPPPPYSTETSPMRLLKHPCLLWELSLSSPQCVHKVTQCLRRAQRHLGWGKDASTSSSSNSKTVPFKLPQQSLDRNLVLQRTISSFATKSWLLRRCERCLRNHRVSIW